MILTPKQIEQCVGDYYDIGWDAIRVTSRLRYIARPRQVAMHLCRKYTHHSLPSLGVYFCRDHTTVLHADRLIKRLAEKDTQIARDLAILSAQIEAKLAVAA